VAVQLAASQEGLSSMELVSYGKNLEISDYDSEIKAAR
jgi:hypothetical protein